MKPRHKWLLLWVVAAIPAVLSTATLSISFGRARSVEFCASCHVMTPYIQDLKNRSSDGLASRHFQHRWIVREQCYTCHTNYDFLGPLNAKWRGFRHVSAYYLAPAGREIKLYKPFPSGNCLQCHGETNRFKEQEAHRAILKDLFDGQMSCLDCHGPAHRTEAARR